MTQWHESPPPYADLLEALQLELIGRPLAGEVVLRLSTALFARRLLDPPRSAHAGAQRRRPSRRSG